MDLLLQKDDIDEYKLLEYSLKDKSKQRFEYLVDWYPEGLLEEYAFDPYIDSAAEFKLVLKAGIKHFPQKYKSFGLSVWLQTALQQTE